MSFKNFFLNESSDKTTIKLSDATKAQELEQYLTNANISFSKSADDVFDIMSPKSVIAKLPFDAEFIDESYKPEAIIQSKDIEQVKFNDLAVGDYLVDGEQRFEMSKITALSKNKISLVCVMSNGFANQVGDKFDSTNWSKDIFFRVKANAIKQYINESEDTTTGYKISFLNEARLQPD
jgi:hypothetical protein